MRDAFGKRVRWPHLRSRSTAPALALAALGLLVAAATALAVTGQLRQLAGTAGCVAEYGGDCADGKALGSALSATVSPDGKSVYVASGTCERSFCPPGGVAAFARNATSGRLTQLPGTAGCVTETGRTPSGDVCADGKALRFPHGVAVSPDGKNAYVASSNSNAVAVFRRDPVTGELTQLAGTAGCVSRSGTDGQCAVGRALRGPLSVAVSGDGENVYVGSGPDAIAVFQRDTTTGELHQLASAAGCIAETLAGCRGGRALGGPFSLAVSADGKNVYVASHNSDAVAVLRRDTSTGSLSQPPGTGGCVSETGSGGACADGKALDGAGSVAVSADGKSLYVASDPASITSHVVGAVAVFRRNVTTGKLTQLVGKAGCVSEDGSGGTCADGKALDGPRSVGVTSDGESVYVVSYFSNAVSAFDRNTTSGGLKQLTGTAGCVSEDGTGGACADGKALQGPSWSTSLATSADARNVYVASRDSSGGAVAVFARELPPDSTPPTFAGLKSATTCIPGPVGGGTTSTYHLSWDPATDNVTPQSKIVYDVYQATAPGSEDFSGPTYTTPPGASSFDTPPLSSDNSYYFVVRARDQAGNRDSNTVERAGENLCV